MHGILGGELTIYYKIKGILLFIFNRLISYHLHCLHTSEELMLLGSLNGFMSELFIKRTYIE